MVPTEAIIKKKERQRAANGCADGTQTREVGNERMVFKKNNGT